MLDSFAPRRIELNATNQVAPSETRDPPKMKYACKQYEIYENRLK